MNDEQRERAGRVAEFLRESSSELGQDLQHLNDECVGIQWQQVQADFAELTKAMEAHNGE